MFGIGGKHIVNTFNLWVVVFVALGTLSTAYGLAIIGSTVGQPNCKSIRDITYQGQDMLTPGSLHLLRPITSRRARLCSHDQHHRRPEWRQQRRCDTGLSAERLVRRRS